MEIFFVGLAAFSMGVTIGFLWAAQWMSEKNRESLKQFNDARVLLDRTLDLNLEGIQQMSNYHFPPVDPGNKLQ